MAFALNIVICHRCPESQLRQTGCNGPCACLADPERRDIIEHAESNDCPLDKYPGVISRGVGVIVDAVRKLLSDEPTPDSWKQRGPLLWARLHHWALYGDIDRPLLWLADFDQEIGCGSCGAHWKQLRAQYPVPTDRDGIFVWTVDRHNDVNRDLGKAEITLEDARKRWNK